VGVLGEREQQMLEGGIFMTTPARFGERRMQSLFEFAGK